MGKDRKESKWIIGMVKLLMLLSVPIFCNSQVSIKNTSLTDQTKNFLYIGIDNKLVVNGLNPGDEICFKNSKLTKSKIIENEYSILTTNTGIDTLQIVNNKQVIFQAEYIVQRIADPKCFFPNVKNELATIGDIISKPYLICKIPDNHLKINFSISSFKISSIHENDTIAIYDNSEFYRPDTAEVEDPITRTVSVIISMKKSDMKYNFGNQLTEYQIRKIQNLKKGSFLYISEIYAQLPDRSIGKMNDILIKIY